MAGVAPPVQPWLAFSRVRWQGGFERRLVRIFDDRIEVRAGRFAIETRTIPMADIYDVVVEGDGALRVVAVPDDIVIDEAAPGDLALAADLIRKNAPPPREKPEPPTPPQPPVRSAPEPPQPEPQPEPQPPEAPARSDPEPPEPAQSAEPPRTVPLADARGPARAVRSLGLLVIGIVVTAILIVVAIGVFVLLLARLLGA